MLEHASGQFTIEGNVEDIFGGISGAARIARISQTCLFTGSLQGESIAEYTAVLPREGDGSFQGFQRISGALGDREGSFVVCVTGDYAKGQPRGSWAIVPKSGSGDFLHIRGNGSFSQSAGKAGKFELEFDLRKPRKTRDAASLDERDANVLVPGIDIAADDELAPESEAAIASSGPVSLDSRPVRRSRKKQEVTESVAPLPVVESTTAPKRPRKKPVPPVVEAVAETLQAEPAPPRKRSRKTASPIVEPQAPLSAEPAPKPRRKRAAPAEVVVAETQPATKTPRSRARKTAVIEETQSVTIEPAPVTASKPARRKKTQTPPPEPLPLPIAQNKPTPRRKAQAA